MEADERDILTRVLREGAASLGLELSDAQAESFVQYADLLREFNAHTNLTRITAPDAIASRHFLDSLSVLRAWPGLPEEARVADVGTGAGFPGVPLKIVRPDLRLFLLDSLRKRLVFLQDLAGHLGLTDVTLIHARAEDAGRDPALRDNCHLVTARAVAALPTLLEWCAPLAKVGGRFVAMKSGNVDAELAASPAAQKALNIRLMEDVSVTLPPIAGEEEPPRNRLLVFQKVRPTPPRYPRRAAEIKAKPL